MARILLAVMTRGGVYQAVTSRCCQLNGAIKVQLRDQLQEVAGATCSDGETCQTANRDTPANVQGVIAWISRMESGSRTPSGPAVFCRLHQQDEEKTAPGQTRQIIESCLQRGSHPQRTFSLPAVLRARGCVRGPIWRWWLAVLVTGWSVPVPQPNVALNTRATKHVPVTTDGIAVNAAPLVDKEELFVALTWSVAGPGATVRILFRSARPFPHSSSRRGLCDPAGRRASLCCCAPPCWQLRRHRPVPSPTGVRP